VDRQRMTSELKSEKLLKINFAFNIKTF